MAWHSGFGGCANAVVFVKFYLCLEGIGKRQQLCQSAEPFVHPRKDVRYFDAYRRVPWLMVSAECDISAQDQIKSAALGSGSIHPDGIVLKNASHCRQDECFDSP